MLHTIGYPIAALLILALIRQLVAYELELETLRRSLDFWRDSARSLETKARRPWQGRWQHNMRAGQSRGEAQPGHSRPFRAQDWVIQGGRPPPVVQRVEDGERTIFLSLN